jgi:hypothetical protein
LEPSYVFLPSLRSISVAAIMASDDEYFVPLQDQRVFGAGVRKKGITFVQAAPLESALPDVPTGSSSAADKYMSIVLGKKDKDDAAKTIVDGEQVTTNDALTNCAVCSQRIASGDKVAVNAHESSIAHQVCLEHSHPPSHLDKEHVGVKYLTAYGWNPDSRLGLGARGEGIRIPIKAKEKYDTVGLREKVDEDDIKVKVKTQPKAEDKVMVRLNAKQVRKQELEAKKRAEKLRASFYGNSDVDKYLGQPDQQPLDFSDFRRR